MQITKPTFYKEFSCIAGAVPIPAVPDADHDR